MIKVHMLRVISVCGKDIFQMEDSPYFGKSNFHNTSLNSVIQKLTRTLRDELQITFIVHRHSNVKPQHHYLLINCLLVH